MIYLHIPQIDHFLFIDIYGKNEQEDLSADDKKVLRDFASVARQKLIDKIAAREREEEL